MRETFQRSGYLPTAIFRSARAACRIRTPESLMRLMPAARPCSRTAPDALDRGARLLGDPACELARS